jgi:hypothetical protein
MGTSPVSPSPFDKVIKEAGKVRTKGGYATLISILLFLCFVFSLMLSAGILQWILTIMSLVGLISYAQYVFRHLKEKNDE